MTRLSTLLVLLTMISGCASVRPSTGGTARVRVTLNYYDPVDAPCTLPLEAVFGHELTIRAPGYKPFFISLKQDAAGWGWRNVNFGHRVVLGLDLAYSAVYYLTDEELVAADDRLQSAGDLLDDHIYVVVTHEHGGHWRQIARLYAGVEE